MFHFGIFFFYRVLTGGARATTTTTALHLLLPGRAFIIFFPLSIFSPPPSSFFSSRPFLLLLYSSLFPSAFPFGAVGRRRRRRRRRRSRGIASGPRRQISTPTAETPTPTFTEFCLPSFSPVRTPDAGRRRRRRRLPSFYRVFFRVLFPLTGFLYRVSSRTAETTVPLCVDSRRAVPSCRYRVSERRHRRRRNHERPPT